MTLSLIVVVTAFLVSVKADNQQPLDIPKTSNNGIVGVASVSGITSRNGRVSSLGGFKFFGPHSFNGEQYFPLSVSAEKDGHYASGTVRVYPGSRGISTSATAGYMPQGWTFNKPASFIYQPSPNIFQLAKNIEPWFARDMFKNFAQPKPQMNNDWLYPSFNPFVNFWR